MTAETYDDLKQYVGSKDDFTDDLLNLGYTKGLKDGYKKALKECKAKRDTIPYIDEFDYWLKGKLKEQK